MRSVLVILLSIEYASAQDLVQNGNFEEYTLCPDYPSQIDRATGWSRPTGGTSDYMNACLGVPFSLSVPDNQFGDQDARSGNGYAGFFSMYANDEPGLPGNYREYVTRPLDTPMVPGQIYSVTFYVSLADVSKYAVDQIGALFSMEIPFRPDEQAIERHPQVSSSDEWLIDKNGWIEITGCFIADSAYSYITIGTFQNAASIEYFETYTMFPMTFYAYYYLDDVSVVPIQRPDLGPDLMECDAVTISVLQPITGIPYAWNTGETGYSISVDSSGTYWVTADLQGCTLSDTIDVSILPTIDLSTMPDTFHDFCLAPSIELNIDSLPPEATVQWDNGHAGNSMRVEHHGTYGFTVNSPDHCPASSQLIVHDSCEHPVFFPNAFTPNGDGINDRFQPVFDPWTTRVEYMIFDRWGREVMSSEGEAWTGEDLSIGIYQLQYETEHLFTKIRHAGRGHVLLIR